MFSISSFFHKRVSRRYFLPLCLKKANAQSLGRGKSSFYNLLDTGWKRDDIEQLVKIKINLSNTKGALISNAEES